MGTHCYIVWLFHLFLWYDFAYFDEHEYSIRSCTADWFSNKHRWLIIFQCDHAEVAITTVMDQGSTFVEFRFTTPI
jgi:hypothetical protein